MQTEARKWGYFDVLFENSNAKLKTLVISPNQGISYQRHFEREELWMVLSGEAKIRYSTSPGEAWKSINVTIYPNQTFYVGRGWWHQVWNEGEKDLKILEVQLGARCTEQDIERLEEYAI